jgi:flagellar motor protein MotB
LSGKKPKTEEGGSKVPGYIVTYSDMVTLLLTFFVMLLSLANTQDPELVSSGRDSFVRALHGYGLGMLFGRTPEYDEGAIKIKHAVENPEEEATHSIPDAKEEELRRLFDEVNKLMTTGASQLVADKTDFTVANVRFDPESFQLDKSDKDFLLKFCRNLQTGAGRGERKLYVLGLARDGSSPKQQWILSAKRAAAVAEFIKGELPSALEWPVYSWGAGPGGDWSSKDSIVSEDQQIAIAVLQEEAE